jgi:hypothetical protein
LTDEDEFLLGIKCAVRIHFPGSVGIEIGDVASL